MTTNDSIMKIKAAEEKAASVREGAVSAAKALVADASSSAEKRFADESAKAAEEKKAAIAALTAEAERRISEECKDADFEAERLTNRANRHMQTAVRYIVREITEKCR